MSLPPPLAIVLRLLGIFIAVSLILSPWLFTVNSGDPFLNQSWLTIGLAFLALSALSLVLPFYGPRRGQIPFLIGLVIFWGALVVSTISSPFPTSLRLCLFIGSQLVLLLFLRVSLNRRDLKSLLLVTILSGGAMSVYALFQRFDQDFINWGPYKVVGTLSNPNFLGAYLMVTGLLALFTLLRAPLSGWWKGVLGVVFLLHLLALPLTKSAGAGLCFVLGVAGFLFPFWQKIRVTISGKRLLESSLVLTVFLTLALGGICLAVRSFPWSQLAGPPFGYFSVVTRLILWNLGFSQFMDSPIFGMGLDSSRYLLTNLRPHLGTFLGMAANNNDPHSLIISLLSETGLAGLFGFVVLWLGFVKIQLRHAPSSVDEKMDPDQVQTWPSKGTSISPEILFIPGMALCLNGSFNNTLSIVPICNLLVLITSFHQTSCLRDIRWRSRFSPLFLPYLLLPILAGPLAWFVQSNHHVDVTQVYEGNRFLQQKHYTEAQRSFELALRANPRSLQAMWGLAGVFEEQKRLRQARETLILLNQTAPNISGARYHIARLFFEERKYLDAHRWCTLHVNWNSSPTGFELLGKILQAEGRAEEAQKTFAEGITRVPSWIKEEVTAAGICCFHLASHALDENELPRARELLRLLPMMLPDSPDIKFLQGLLEYKSGNASTALPLFEMALNQKPDDPRFGNALGFLLSENNLDLPRAKTLLLKAYEVFKNRSPSNLADILSVTHSLGILHWKLGELDKAQELLIIAWKETPAGLTAIRARREGDMQRFLKETGRIMPAMPR